MKATDKQVGIDLVKELYGQEIVEYMQKTPEDESLLGQIGEVVTRLEFLHSCTLKVGAEGKPVLESGGTSYGPRDMTPAGTSAGELICGNFNSINVELPEGVTRWAFVRLFCE